MTSVLCAWLLFSKLERRHAQHLEIAEAARREERQRTWYCTQESGVQFLVSKHA